MIGDFLSGPGADRCVGLPDRFDIGAEILDRSLRRFADMALEGLGLGGHLLDRGGAGGGKLRRAGVERFIEPRARPVEVARQALRAALGLFEERGGETAQVAFDLCRALIEQLRGLRARTR